jgi:hypothetical protein
MKKQQYIVRKYVMASSAREAIRLEAKTPAHDVWVDQDWVKQRGEDKSPAIGFTADLPDDE